MNEDKYSSVFGLPIDLSNISNLISEHQFRLDYCENRLGNLNERTSSLETNQREFSQEYETFTLSNGPYASMGEVYNNFINVYAMLESVNRETGLYDPRAIIFDTDLKANFLTMSIDSSKDPFNLVINKCNVHDWKYTFYNNNLEYTGTISRVSLEFALFNTVDLSPDFVSKFPEGSLKNREFVLVPIIVTKITMVCNDESDEKNRLTKIYGNYISQLDGNKEGCKIFRDFMSYTNNTLSLFTIYDNPELYKKVIEDGGILNNPDSFKMYIDYVDVVHTAVDAVETLANRSRITQFNEESKLEDFANVPLLQCHVELALNKILDEFTAEYDIDRDRFSKEEYVTFLKLGYQFLRNVSDIKYEYAVDLSIDSLESKLERTVNPEYVWKYKSRIFNVGMECSLTHLVHQDGEPFKEHLRTGTIAIFNQYDKPIHYRAEENPEEDYKYLNVSSSSFSLTYPIFNTSDGYLSWLDLSNGFAPRLKTITIHLVITDMEALKSEIYTELFRHYIV